MATCHKCGTNYTNRGGPSLECDCGRKTDLARIASDDQASAVMVETMRKATERIKAHDITGLCAMVFGVGAAMHRAKDIALTIGMQEAADAADSLFQLVRDALDRGYKEAQ